jgi:hypothetical protein
MKENTRKKAVIHNKKIKTRKQVARTTEGHVNRKTTVYTMNSLCFSK